MRGGTGIGIGFGGVYEVGVGDGRGGVRWVGR